VSESVSVSVRVNVSVCVSVSGKVSINASVSVSVSASVSASASVSVSVLDRRSRILEVVIVRRLVTWVLGIWSVEGLGKGLRKGRSVYKQPETRVDGSCHS
jgi:hypothetical protein